MRHVLVSEDSADNDWSNVDLMLWRIEYTLRVLSWQQSGKGQRPKPLELPSEILNQKHIADTFQQTKQEVDRALGLI